MSEKKQCVNCNRGIDVAAKSCLYCNWWQAEKPQAKSQQAGAPSATSAPVNHRNRNILGAIAFVALLIIAFVIGSLIHGFEPSEVKAAQQPKTPGAVVATQAPEPPTANIPLVPDNSAPPGPIDQTTTNAAGGVTTTVSGAMGGDATAMTSQQYGALQQPAQPQQQVQTVDPRSVTGTVYGQTQPTPPRVPRPQPQRRPEPSTVSHMTQPVPEFQPVPSLHGHGHAKLTLTVGPDGHVRDIDIVEPLAGEMGRLIGAVQSWRFRPAMDNGVPVTSRFTVDINVD